MLTAMVVKPHKNLSAVFNLYLNPNKAALNLCDELEI